MGESRGLCEISKELWEAWKACFWLSMLSTAPPFPQLAHHIFKPVLHVLHGRHAVRPQYAEAVQRFTPVLQWHGPFLRGVPQRQVQ